MSNFVSDTARADEGQVATAKHGESTNLLGQRHDRVGGGDESDGSTMASSANEPEAEVAISTGQKMLSAVSGSLLTSLLGNTPHLSLAIAIAKASHFKTFLTTP